MLLLSLAFSSVFGIVENRSVSFPDPSFNPHLYNKSFPKFPSRHVFHEAYTDKEEILLENEDGKEEVFAEASNIITGGSSVYFRQRNHNPALCDSKPISLNILYCVFRI